MKKYFPVYITLFALAAFLVFSMTPQGRDSVSDALSVCANKLVPSLFVSVAASVFIMKSGLFYFIPKKTASTIGYLFKVPKDASAAVIIGLVSGFPSGAVAVYSLYERKILSEYDARRLAAIFSVPSLSFVIGFVGSGLLESALLGTGIYLSVVLSSLTLGILTSEKSNKNLCKTVFKKNEIISNIAPSIVEAAGKTVTLCGFVIFFSAFSAMLTSPFSDNKFITYAVYSVFEISKASVMLSSLSDVGISVVLLSAVLSFGGLSTAFQIASVTGFPIGEYIALKALSAIFSAFFSFVLFFLPKAAAVIFAVFTFSLFFCKKLIYPGKYKQNAEHDAKSFVTDIPDKNG